MYNQFFIEAAKKHFAEVLKVEVSKIDELYHFVNTHFYIKVVQNKGVFPHKSETFSAKLHFIEPDELGEDCTLMSFGDQELEGRGIYYDEFPDEETALLAAYKHINSVEFTPKNSPASGGELPCNMLVLFDAEYKKKRAENNKNPKSKPKVYTAEEMEEMDLHDPYCKEDDFDDDDNVMCR